ncbi:hypothetical protein ANANG_G00105660 [Anguilla anguilla]|uniref:WH2 domain-containing protein n=1 Tax=Anguilla anguilla TaxID=7936 RepID=A0A9D3MHS9_ANGAN|nr:hypothetical protein ANANG_G00105660 [Anguilla anguilla]
MPLLSEQEGTPFPAKSTLKQNIGSMDEVLASLQRGQMQLRKVGASPAQAASPAAPEDLRDSILSAIRRGVKLKKVQPGGGGGEAGERGLGPGAEHQSRHAEDEEGVLGLGRRGQRGQPIRRVGRLARGRPSQIARGEL